MQLQAAKDVFTAARTTSHFAPYGHGLPAPTALHEYWFQRTWPEHPVSSAPRFVRIGGWASYLFDQRTLFEEKTSMNLYVGNLAYTVTEAELRTAFEAFGEVDRASVITDRDSGRSKGFGFVEMPNNSEADAAIKALNDTPLNGRAIKVNEARPRENRPRGGGGGRY